MKVRGGRTRRKKGCSRKGEEVKGSKKIIKWKGGEEKEEHSTPRHVVISMHESNLCLHYMAPGRDVAFRVQNYSESTALIY